jgi:hypothetical protein
MNMEDMEDPVSAPKRGHRTRYVILGGLGVIALIVVIITVIASGGSKPVSGGCNGSCPSVTNPAVSAPVVTAPTPQITDPDGEVCDATDATAGYCPGDSPPPPPPPPPPPVYNPVTDSQWQLIQEDPGTYAGQTFTVTGTVTQHDANTGADEFRADAGPADNPDTNTIFDGSGDGSQVAPLQVGQAFTAQVSVEGSLSYTTTLGGTTTVPELLVVSISA